MAKITFSLKSNLLYATFVFSALLYSCASMQNPQGGPKDTDPPKIVNAEPKNLTKNFSAKKITIDFDEYIKLTNEFKEFTISPEQEKPPILKVKGKRLEVSLQDSLEKNTTYTLNFGKSITDINEGNPIKNFQYVFSTGSTLDSLSISGNVKNALTGKPELDAVVMIIPLAKDSIFGKRKPSIYTTTDSSGNFKLNNLRKDSYKVYALKEQSGDKIYQQVNDEVGFLKEPIALTGNIDSIKLTVFKELATVFRIIDRKLNNDGSITMNFNQNLRKPEIKVIDPVAIDQQKYVKFNKTNDSVKVWLSDLGFDSIKVAIYDEGKGLDTLKFTRGKKDTYIRNVTVADNLEGTMLNPNKDLRLHFNFPIEKIDLTKVELLEDSIPRKGFTLTKDSLDQFTGYIFKYPWKRDENYILKIGEGAVTAIFNAKNKEINKKFTLANPDDYGTLILNVEPTDTVKSYVLEIVDEKKDYVVSSQRISKATKVSFSNYRVGIYYGRIVYDENKNGTWDTGNVKLGIQPEKIWYIPKELSIRANWERTEAVKIPGSP
jgi:uncharacterized protein (DUF2141 family)